MGGLIAVGRSMGIAMIQWSPIGLTFPTFFYGRLLGKEITLDDIREDEPGLFHSLAYIVS